MKRVETAIAAVRGEARHNGVDPSTLSWHGAEEILDELGRKGIAAGLWYWSASDREITQFRREWNKWKRSQKNEVVRGVIETCDHCEEKVDHLRADDASWMLCPKCWPLYHLY